MGDSWEDSWEDESLPTVQVPVSIPKKKDYFDEEEEEEEERVRGAPTRVCGGA
jgi:hypothetical protein